MCLSILLRCSNDLEKEFNKWKVEAMRRNVVRV